MPVALLPYVLVDTVVEISQKVSFLIFQQTESKINSVSTRIKNETILLIFNQCEGTEEQMF